jgi:hypothetical protein
MIRIGPLDYLSLWGVFVLTAALLFLATELGYLLGIRKRRRAEDAAKAPLGEVVAAMLGLLALLLAFTFNMAATRFDTRRGLVLDEANAIGTTWLRAGFLSEPHRSEARKLLREYLEIRLTAIQSGQFDEAILRSEELQQQLWAHAIDAGQQQPNSVTTGLFVLSLNELIDLHAARVMRGARTRVPVPIWAALYFVGFLSMGAIGYHGGIIGVRRSLSVLLPILTFAGVLLLIADLDRPREGLFKVSQQSLIDLRNLMNSSP